MARPFDIDPDQIADIIRDAAETEILPRFRQLESHEITEKNPGDLVTVADQMAEAYLHRRLESQIPGALIIGEEAHETNPKALQDLSSAEWAWVIDPVDGTHNFAHGRAKFAVILALVHRGETVFGWIYDPVNGRLAAAEKGAGAFLDGAALRRKAPIPIAGMTGSVGPKLGDRVRQRAAQHGDEIPKRFLRYRCVGLEYMDVAAGVLDFARYAGRMMPWDHAAGVLLCQEAGGHAAMTGDGRGYAPGSRPPGDALLLAPDTETWSALNQLLF